MKRHIAGVMAVVVGASVGCGGSQRPPRTELAVVGSPIGGLGSRRKVTLTFTRPMVTADRIGVPTTGAPLTFEPSLAGEARWVSDTTLEFIPSSTLPVSTRYVATVPQGTRALDGHQLARPYTFEFLTERLMGSLEMLGSESRAGREPVVKLTFNQDVAFSQVETSCRFKAGKTSHNVLLGPDSERGPGRVYTVMPVTALATDTDWTFSCGTALRGVAGNLGPIEPLELAFHTYGPFRYVDITPNGNDIVPDDEMQLQVAFTNPLAKPLQIQISPAVRGFPERCHVLGDEPAGIVCGTPLEPRTSYTITIAATQKDVFGQVLGKQQVIELRTTDAEPTISADSGYLVAELKRPVLPVWTRNVSKLEVTALAVTPANFHQLSPLLNWWEPKPVDFAATKLEPVSRTIEVAGTKNQWGQRPIDPVELLGVKPGPGMYYLEIGAADVKRYPFEDGGRQKLLVNFTDLGVVSKLSPTRGLVWVTRLSTGKPLGGAQVSVRDASGKVTFSATTDAAGVAMLPGTSKLSGAAGAAAGGEGEGEGEFEGEAGGGLHVFVSHRGDFTMVNADESGGLSAWNFNVSQDHGQAPVKLRGFMHTDRGLYRPGEKVHVKGLARLTKLGAPLAAPPVGDVAVEVQGPLGKTFAETHARLSKFGGFWFDLDLPGDARLGDYTVVAKLAGGTFTSTFSVEEYRAATFEVTGKARTERVVRQGSVDATIAASYLYGAPLRSGDVAVAIHSRPRIVSFPQHDEFAFTDQREYERYGYASEDYAQTLVAEDHLAVDSQGNASFAINVGPGDITSDADLLVRASVSAPSAEVISKSFTIPYYRSQRYFGIKRPGYLLDVGKPQKFEIVGVRPDGKPAGGSAKLTVTRRDWNCVWEDWGYRGSYHCNEIKEPVMARTLTLGDKPVSVEFTPAGGGEYLVTVEGTSADDATAAVSAYAWGDGSGSARSDDSLTFDILADKKEYAAGDTATLVLKTDLAQATGLVTIERDGVIENKTIDVGPTTKHVQIPITDNHAPNIYVSVALVQGRLGEGRRGQPRMKMGLVNLPVRPKDNRLTVAIETDKADYRPGAPVTATVKVTSAAGKPVAAEVSLTAADEGVLSLIAYETPDPVPAFYAPWGIGVRSATQIAFLRDIPGPNQERPATGGDSGGGSVRSRFMSTAVWQPGLVTNAAGIAKVTFAAPDNLTAFRLMAVAADRGQRFGSADKRFTVSKPLQLHRALPRFATVGDKFQGGVVVHNETGQTGRATIKLTGAGPLAIHGGERTLTVEAGARVPVLFDLEAKDAGDAALTFTVAMNGETDGIALTLPVHHPSGVRVHHVAHGQAASGKAQTVAVALPANAIPSSAKLFVSVDPDGLAGIEEGLRDLIGYPYGCLEQTSSQLLPMIAVRDLAESLELAGLRGDKLNGYIAAGVAKIGRFQTTYGGFALWPGGEPDPYYTGYALWVLHLAQKAGHKVDPTRIEDALNYLRGDGQRPNTSEPHYSEAGNLGSQAFALYVRAMLGDKDTQAATAMLAQVTAMPIYGRAFLARAIAAGNGAQDPAVMGLVGDLEKLAAAAASKESLIEEPDDDNLEGYMSGSMRTTAIVLETLVELAPTSPAIKPLVRALMAKRRGALYIDTQANLYSLLALTTYARSLPETAPEVTVSVGGKKLIDGKLAGKQRVKSGSVALPAASAVDIASTGEVHYNVELRYRQTTPSLVAESAGLELSREYLDADGKPKTTFAVGDVVKVKLTIPITGETHHLMVSDRLPAGFEPLNTRFATVGDLEVSEGRGYWGGSMEMHDERVDISTEYNWQATYVREYMVRAIAAGKFVQPQATAELMYSPETHSRTAVGQIEIAAKGK